MSEMRCALVEIVGLRLPAANPADALERGERGGGCGGVGRLAVVDERDPFLLADALHSMREAGVSLQSMENLVVVKAELKASVISREDVLQVVGTLERGPVLLAREMRLGSWR